MQSPSLTQNTGIASEKKEKLGNILVISIILASYTLFFYFQITTEFSTLEGIFESNRDQQILLTESTASKTGVKLGIILNNLAILSQTEALQIIENTPGDDSLSEARQQFLTRGIEADLTVTDSQGLVLGHSGNLSASNFSEYEWFQTAINSERAIFSDIYSLNNQQVFSLTHPVRDESGRYIGLAIATIKAEYITADYSLLATYLKEYLIFDKDFQVLASSDEGFGVLFSTALQEGDSGLQTMTQNLSAGNAGDTVYRTETEEILLTGYPVHIQDLEFFVVITSPTSTFYSQVEEVLFNNRIQTFSILAATSVLTVIIASFINRNIKLDKEVREKTKELETSNLMIKAQKDHIEKANKELTRLDEMKSRFISIASHELKNPIQPILLNAEMAAAGDIDKDKAIEVIIRQAYRLRQLASDILDVSRIDANTLVLNKQRIRIGDLISDIATANKVGAKPDVSLVIDVDENTEMFIDPVRMGQVLSNILQNSFKFTEKGKISIRKKNLQTQSGSYIEIVISDTGVGIPKEIFPNLFNKFVTMDAGGKNKNGTGLGLYICKGIVAAHGGEISAYNNPDAGASVRIVIPVNDKRDDSVKISRD